MTSSHEPRTATITRDRWGIGHVRTADPLDAFWAQGWLAAADRLWQMEWDRLRAQGRWASVAGPAAVAEDSLFRRIELAAVSRAHYDGLTDRAKAMTEAYVGGINAWLAANGHNLPEELACHPAPPERWEPWHCVAVYKVRHIFMGTLHRKLWRGAVTLAAGPDLARLMVGNPGSASAMVPLEEGSPTRDLLADAVAVMEAAAADLADLAGGLASQEGGSNSWAIHGSRTASGKPILAGDPHRGIEFPNAYHQCHLTCDGFDVIGLAFPGVPGFPHFGHSERVAWAITHGMADDTDVFVEREPVAVDRTETIEIHGADPVTVPIARTGRGPVILGDPAAGDGRPVLSMMWTGIFAPDTTFDSLWPMLEAGTVDDFERTQAAWALPVNNLLTASVDGDISFHLRGHVVERPVANRWTPVPGDGFHGWDGLEPVPFERLHAWRNPQRGFLVTANNRTGDGGPYISLDFAGPSRHDRIVELLYGLGEAATVADMPAIHGDVRSLRAPAVLAGLRRAAPRSAGGRAALALLDGWDCEVGASSAAALVYGTVKRLWADEVGHRLGIGGANLGGPAWPPAIIASRMLFDGAGVLLRTAPHMIPGLASDTELAAALGAVFDRAAAELGERYGPDPAGWAWGAAHTMLSPHPLASVRPEMAHLHPPVDPTGGDGDTVRAGTVMPHAGDRSASASVARYAFDLADWDASGWVVPHGVSGVRGSGHDLNQRSAWLACELLPMAYSPSAVAAAAASSETITIGSA